MQLSKKLKTFCESLSAFFKSTSSFEYFEKKDDPYRLCVSGITDFERLTFIHV